MNLKTCLLILLLSVWLQKSWAQGADYSRTPNGLAYKILEKGTANRKVQIGDMIDFRLTVKNFKDSLIGTQAYKGVQVSAAVSKIDVREIFSLLSKGDSAVCWVSVDSVVKISGEEPPRFFPKGTSVKYFFRILDVKSKADMQAAEAKILAEYAQKNSLKPQVTASGLQYAVILQGTGAKPQPGQTVKVNYTGKLLDGKVFDTSLEYIAQANNIFNPNRPYQPIGFALGQGQVIRGWDEGIGLLNVGSRAILLIPSYLAYGERAMGNDIPANSPLVFEVELVSIE
ncbi:MAG: FKBP-type peptidyl-prolyl cis-trans isomerase [Microscillaceae bacterium]|jgi:FKBP-type peptidyl-prolyl cis-trans isomerase|nr:FKBP-type peptidyl-prolyl cis-trans isomerase [Microscillaceae bacterium]